MRQFKPGQLQTGSIYPISASYALTASYVSGSVSIDTGSLVTTASFNAYTASQALISQSFNSRINSLTGSINTLTSSYNSFTSSYTTGSFTGSFTGIFNGTASRAISSSISITASYAIAGGDQDLQRVTDRGFTTTNPIYVVAHPYAETIIDNGYVLTQDYNNGSVAALFNDGTILLKPSSSTGAEVLIRSTNILSSSYNLDLPNKPGGTYTIATTDELLKYNTTSSFNAFTASYSADSASFSLTKQNIPIVISSSITAENNQVYHVIANATFTDPTGVDGKGYFVVVRSATSVVLGGNSYITGETIHRIFYSGSWFNIAFRPSTYVPISRTINGQALTSNITLTASDVGAVSTSSFNAFTASYTTGSFTGSFTGDGSGLINLPIPSIDTGSLVTTASFNSFTSSIQGQVDSLTAATSSYLLINNTASMLAPYVLTSSTSSMTVLSSSYAVTASYIQTAQTASFITASNVVGTVNSASNALTASYYQETDPIFVAKSASLATTGSNIFTGTQIITGSNGRLIYTGTTSGVYPTNTLAEIHANDDYPWLERFYNDTFSTSSAIMAYFGWSDGRFVFHNESTQSIGLQVNGFGAENGLLVYSDKVAFVNNVEVTGSLNVVGVITSSLFGTASWATNSVTASFVTASNVVGTVTSASYALTASYISGSVNINTGSLVTTASFNAFTSSINSFTASYNTGSFTGSFTGLFNGTSSWANNSLTASYITLAQTASYVTTAQTASYILQAISSSFASTASYVTLAQTASYVLNAVSSSFASTASYATIAGNGGVTQLLAGPNIILGPTNGLGQVTVSATLSGSTIFNTATGSYGSFYSTSSQTNPVGNIPRSMSLDHTDITNGVSISGSTNPFNTYIKTENAGVYNIQFSAQVDKTDGGTDDIVIWLRKNGIDLTDTATTLTLPTNNSKVVAAWNWFVTSTTGDYYQIIWRSADTDLRLLAEPISGTHPGIPSVIVTANRVDQFLSNTGSFSGSFTGNFTGSLLGTAATASYVLNAISSSFASTASFITASNVVGTVSSASYALTASYAMNGGGGGGGTTFIRRSDYTSSLDPNVNYLYLGDAVSGSLESQSVWDISRLSISSSGATLTQTTSSAAWTNRYSYTYL